MHLIDLAGSERVDKSEVTGDRLKEVLHVNRSLSALGDVVQYRNSKLTQLLQDSLGGQAKTLMFVRISPEPDAIGETISTLKFAERVASVELGAARVNKDSSDVKELKDQIASLKAALARKDEELLAIQQSPCSIPSARNSRMKSPNSLRKPMEEVGNIEIHKNSALRQKKSSLDLDELLGKDEVENNDIFYQKYNQYDVLYTADDDLDELDTGISDSSEPDMLLWRFNHSNHGSFSNGIAPKVQKPNLNKKPGNNLEEYRYITQELLRSSYTSQSHDRQQLIHLLVFCMGSMFLFYLLY